jgi:uncharacterized protein involved in exopolysaccharide biosynthesis
MAALLTATAVGIGSCFSPPTYVASGSLLVKLGREFIYRPELNGMESSEMYRLDEMINSETEILSSHDLAARVVAELGDELYPGDTQSDPRATFKAVAAFEDALTVTAVPESSVIRLSFEHSDPDLAAIALNRLIELFSEKHLAVFGDASSTFLAERTSEAEVRLKAAEATLSNFRLAHGLWDLDHQLNLLLRQRSNLDVELKTTETRVVELAELTKDGWPNTQPGQGAAPGSFPPLSSLEDREAVEDAQMQLLQLRMRERQLADNYSEVSRTLTAVRSEISLVESFLIEAITDELSATRQRLEAQRAQLASLDAEIRRLTEAGRELVELERAAETLREQHRTYLSRRDDARISAQLQEEDLISVRVIDRATPPLKPRGMPTQLRIILGCLTGLALGVAVAVLRRATAPLV